MAIPKQQLDDWLFELKLNGFIVFRSFLPADLIDAMNEQFKEFLALEIEMDQRGRPLSGRGEKRFAVNIGAMADKMGGPLNDPRARRNPLIEELVTSVLGKWRYSKLIVECPCKGSDYMGWHIDSIGVPPSQRVLPKTTTQLKLHIPLVDVGDANAPMEVIPGSHRMWYFEGDEAVQKLPQTYFTRILTRRGDCFLRDGDLIHRGTPNQTDVPRPLYSQIYKALT